MANCIFIIPPFFDYPLIIERELSNYFDNVFRFYSAPKGFSYKLFSFIYAERLCKTLLDKNSESIKKAINKMANDVEMILIVKASLLSEDFCKWLRIKFPKAKMVQYLWDNISTDVSSCKTLSFFDENFSFSPEDSMKYGLKYRPFFYNPIPISIEKNIDITCIASFSQDRAQILENVLAKNSDFLSARHLFWHIKGSIPLFYRYRKYTKLIKPYLQLSSISYSKMLNVLGHSKAQLDIPNPKQTGLTTRSFESLWTKTKIITTNKSIINYDFYNESNVLIIDKDNPYINQNWLDSPFKNPPEYILKKYSLQSFITDLIGISNNFNNNLNGQQN